MEQTATSNFKLFMGTEPKISRTVPGAQFYPAKTQPKLRLPLRSDIPRYNDWLGSKQGGQLIEALTNENDVLKDELASLKKYLKSVVSIFSKLEQENTDYRNLLEEKAKDVERLVQTLMLNEEANDSDYQQQIHRYQEELDLLTRHQIQLTEQMEDSGQALQEKVVELDRAKQYNEQMKSNLEATLIREKSLTNEVELTKLRNQQLTQENEEISLKMHKYDQQLELITKSRDQLQNENQELKATILKIESENAVRMNVVQGELDVIKLELSRTQASTSSNQSYLHNYRSEISTLRVKNTELITLSDTQAKELQNLHEQIKLESSRRAASMQRESQLANQLSIAEEELKKLKARVSTLQEELKQKQKEVDNEILGESAKHLKTIEMLKQKYNTQLKDKDLVLLRTDTELKSALEKNEVLTLQNAKLEKELQELKNKLGDYQQQQRRVNDLAIQLRDKSNTIVELEAMLKDYQQQVQRNTSDHEDRIISLEEQLRRAEIENEHLQRELDQAKWFQENQRQQTATINALRAEIDSLQRQLESMKRLEDNIKQKYEEAETTILSLETQCKQMKSQVINDQGLQTKIKQLQEENEFLKLELRSLQKLQNKPYSSSNSKYEQTTNSKNSESNQRGGYFSSPGADFSTKSTPKLPSSRQGDGREPVGNVRSQQSLFTSPPQQNRVSEYQQSPYLEYDYPVKRGGSMKPVLVNYRR